MTYLDILENNGGSQAQNRASSEPKTTLAVRVNSENPDHHLWNNRGTWWCHFTLHRSDYTAERVRVSLKTRSRDEARSRRDELLVAVAS